MSHRSFFSYHTFLENAHAEVLWPITIKYINIYIHIILYNTIYEQRWTTMEYLQRDAEVILCPQVKGKDLTYRCAAFQPCRWCLLWIRSETVTATRHNMVRPSGRIDSSWLVNPVSFGFFRGTTSPLGSAHFFPMVLAPNMVGRMLCFFSSSSVCMALVGLDSSSSIEAWSASSCCWKRIRSPAICHVIQWTISHRIKGKLPHCRHRAIAIPHNKLSSVQCYWIE